MSADVWLAIDTGGTETARVTDTINCTYNLTPMLREAGFCGWRELLGRAAGESLPLLLDVQRALLADPSRFQGMNPPNGWGTYEGLLRVVADMIAAAGEHPKATWEGWL